MTHEHQPNAEAPDGPEHTRGLPDAAAAAVHGRAEDSDLPPLTGTRPHPGGPDDPEWWGSL